MTEREDSRHKKVQEPVPIHPRTAGQAGLCAVGGLRCGDYSLS